MVPDDGPLLTLGSHVLPLLPGCEVANWSRDVILQRPSKHLLGWGEVGSRVRSVAMDEEAPGKLVIVEVEFISNKISFTKNLDILSGDFLSCFK